MIEYPSIMNSSKAPRSMCVGFAKLDGSNFRAKWTRKQGFTTFGSRHELIDESHKFLGEAVTYFKQHQAEPLHEFFKRDERTRNEREAIVFGEFFGPRSFAGFHQPDDPKEVVIFDVLVGHKDRKFFNPLDFVDTFQSIVQIPPVLHCGNLTDELIKNVREGKLTAEFHKLTGNKFTLFEGIVCKGTLKTGAARGGIWMCKVKTQEYFDALRNRWGEEGIEKYGE